MPSPCLNRCHWCQQVLPVEQTPLSDFKKLLLQVGAQHELELNELRQELKQLQCHNVDIDRANATCVNREPGHEVKALAITPRRETWYPTPTGGAAGASAAALSVGKEDNCADDVLWRQQLVVRKTPSASTIVVTLCPQDGNAGMVAAPAAPLEAADSELVASTIAATLCQQNGNAGVVTAMAEPLEAADPTALRLVDTSLGHVAEVRARAVEPGFCGDTRVCTGSTTIPSFGDLDAKESMTPPMAASGQKQTDSKECQKQMVGLPSMAAFEQKHTDLLESRKTMLAEIFAVAEEEEAKKAKLDNIKQTSNRVEYLFYCWANMTLSEKTSVIESWFGGIIVFNALFITVQMDHGEGTLPWVAVDLGFLALYALELMFKIKLAGFYLHFCGAGRISNCFDASLVFIDTFQLILFLVAPNAAENMEGLPSASLFRLLRLMKLARLARLLRSEVFKDLVAMVQGMLGGLSTLGWSIVLFLLMVIVVALFFRELFGRDATKDPNVYEYFNNVPRSIYTTFRCSFGDCATIGGLFIFEIINEEYGALYTILCSLFTFAVTVGVFNVVSAIFVESTMSAAVAVETTRQKARLQNKILWRTRIATLIKRLMDVSPDHSIPGNLSQSVDEIMRVDVDGKVLDMVVQDEEAIHALRELDINEDDYPYLSDILDPDNTGRIPVFDFIDGLRRLRGQPRRSDIVCVDLMVRSIQQNILEVMHEVKAIMNETSANLASPVPVRSNN